jgi:hypothetical protein
MGKPNACVHESVASVEHHGFIEKCRLGIRELTQR